MKTLYFFLSLFLMTNSTLSSQSLCQIYGEGPYDYEFDGTFFASELDPADFNGKHILFKGDLYLDTDFEFIDCTINYKDGRIIYDIPPVVPNTISEIKMTNVKFYACNSLIANIIAGESLNSNNGIFAKVTLSNCVFENFYELMHIHGGQYDVRNCTFVSEPGNQYSHAFHILHYGTVDNYAYRQFHFSGNKFYNIPSVFQADNCEGIEFGNNLDLRNEFYNCGKRVNEFIANDGIFNGSFFSVENNYFNNCDNIRSAKYFGNNEFLNVKTAITSTTYAKDNIFINNYKQNSSFLNVTTSNQFMINNTINQLAQGSLSKKPNAGYIKSGIGKMYIENGQFNGVSQTRYVDNSIAQLDISNENVIGGTLITRGVTDYDIYNTHINKNGGFSGFNMTMSNGTICNSSSKNASRAYSFRGNCMDTNLNENEIGTSTTGLYIDNIIGPQEHKGNTWVGNYSGEGVTNTSTNTLFSRFTVNSNPNSGGNSLYKPQNGSYSPSTLFDEDGTTTSIDECIYEFGPNGLVITDIDILIMNNAYNIDPLSNWLAIRNLIRKIITNPSLLNDPNVNNWYQNNVNTAVGITAEVEEILDDYYGDDVDIIAIKGVFKDYEAGIHTAIEADDALSLINADIKVIQNQKYTEINSLLGSYTPTNVFEDVFVETYQVYIEYLNDAEYLPSSQELTTIGQNANLCPLSYGPSIYIARSLADTYRISYDVEYCIQSRTRSQSKTVNDVLVLYPNPATDIINIEVKGDILQATIINARGILVKSSTSRTIDTESLPNGLYYVKVLTDNGSLHISQLVILK